jgi:hypothetical protein
VPPAGGGHGWRSRGHWIRSGHRDRSRILADDVHGNAALASFEPLWRRGGLANGLFYLLAFSVILDIILRADPHDHDVKYCSCGKPLPPFAVATGDPWCSSGCARKAFGVTIQPGTAYTVALKPRERTRLQQLRMQVAEARREQVLEEAEKYVSGKRAHQLPEAHEPQATTRQDNQNHLAPTTPC